MSTATPPDDDGKLIEGLDAGEPARSPEEAAARLPYQRLIERIQDLDEIEPPSGWEERAEQRWHAHHADTRKRRRRRAALALSLGGAAVAAAILLRPCAPGPEGPPAPLVVTTTRSGAQMRGDAIVGDDLVARTHIQAAYVELRVYWGTKLIARCPGHSGCQGSVPRLGLTLKLTEEGIYRVVAFSSKAPIPEPGPDYTSDIARADDADITIDSSAEPITVHR